MAIPSTTYDIATATNPSSALTDFTFIVDLSNMSTAWWTAVDTTDGTKGRASKSDGTTELACDWIDFDSTLETGILRVKYTGTLASTGTQQVRIYPPISTNASYGVSDTYGQYNAYDLYWEAYWPLDGDQNDRTSNIANATNDTGTPSPITGEIGNGLLLDDGEWISTSGGSFSFSDSQITVLAWGRPSSNSISIIGSDTTAFEMALRRDSGVLQFVLNSFSSNDRVSGGTTLNTTGVWQHLGGVYDGTDLKVYLDGLQDGTTTPSGSWGSFTNIIFGGFGRSAATDWRGSIDEGQIHSIGRSAQWISEEYEQTSDNATFWGTWTNVPVGGDPSITADSGSFTVTGTDASLIIDRSISGESTSFSITGQDASLLFDRSIIAEGGSFSLAGDTSSLILDRVANIETGTFTLIGNDATLTYTHGTDRSIITESGAFTLIGKNASLYAPGDIIGGSLVNRFVILLGEENGSNRGINRNY